MSLRSHLNTDVREVAANPQSLDPDFDTLPIGHPNIMYSLIVHIIYRTAATGPGH